jgi:hypothetical protein
MHPAIQHWPWFPAAIASVQDRLKWPSVVQPDVPANVRGEEGSRVMPARPSDTDNPMIGMLYSEIWSDNVRAALGWIFQISIVSLVSTTEELLDRKLAAPV